MSIAALVGKALAYVRFVRRLRPYLDEPLGADGAPALLRERLGRRADSFLRSVRLCVFERPGSPYLPLFTWAGCGYGDLEADVRDNGPDAALKRLAKAGVRLSLDEFKGRAPIVRDGLEVSADATDFDSPFARAVPGLRTGGSTGRPVRIYKDLDYLAARTAYDHVFFRELGIEDAPLALWYPGPPAAAGFDNAIRYAKGGRSPARWFDMQRPGLRSRRLDGRLLTVGASWASRGAANRIPYPEQVPLGDVSVVLAWLLRQRERHRRAVVQSYVSQAVRLSRYARDRGVDLDDIVLIIGSEPMTPAKHAEIAASGATVFLRYFCSELGSVGVGCTVAEEPDDLHLMSDLIAMIKPEAAEDSGERPFLFTSLCERMPKVMINTSLGDCGEVEERECACPFGELGFTTHIRDVHSVQRVTCEGMTVSVADLSRVMEEVLRPKYGGSTVDYQWVACEGPGGHSRLRLRIAPAVGPVDAGELTAAVLSELARSDRGSRLIAGVWQQAGTLGVERAQPRFGPSAKALPFVRE
jgi:hypothetical protein